MTSIHQNKFAGVAELVDAPGLGPGGSNPVEVQVLSPAHIIKDAHLGVFYYMRCQICRASPPCLPELKRRLVSSTRKTRESGFFIITKLKQPSQTALISVLI